MAINRALQAFLALIAAAAGTPAAAQTIYPITRAEILAGAKFDFKVEFPGTVAAPDIKVTVNGRDAAQAFGKPATVDGNEEGQGHTAYWIRDVTIEQPGTYEVTRRGRRQVADGQMGRVRHPGAARAQRDPVHRRRPVRGAPHRRARAVQGPGRRPLRRRARHRRHAAHGARLHVGHGLASSPTSANSMSAYTTGHKSCVNAMGVYCARNKSGLAHPKVETIAELVKRRNGGMGDRRRHQHRDRGRDARRHGRARAPPQRLRRDRAHVLRGQARRDDGRRHAASSCRRRTRPASARTRRTTSRSSRRRATGSRPRRRR